MRYQIRPVKLNKYFPPNDELAFRIAQLCILREDHLLELRGITIDSAGELDGKFEEWRSLYFFRKSARTINEIRRAISGMGTLNQYKQLLNSDPKERTRIRKLTSELDKEYEHVKNLGDNVGAHILHQHLKTTLNDLDVRTRLWFIMPGRLESKRTSRLSPLRSSLTKNLKLTT